RRLGLIASFVLLWPSATRAQSGLVAAYAFDEVSGSSVLDVSSFNNGGTFGTGVTRVAGKYGGALAFSGGSARVTVPNSSSLTLTSAMTLEAWVNPTNVSAVWRDIVMKGTDNYFLMGTTDNSGRPAGGGIFGT